MTIWRSWILLIVWPLLLGSYARSQLGEVEADLTNKLTGLIQWKYEKRPFCNAFTGCGRKRDSPVSPYPLLKRAEFGLHNDASENSNSHNIVPIHDNLIDGVQNTIGNNEEMADAISDLIDINAEPAVENVQKQIMSQAKIFEAIREASKEIFRQRTRQKLRRQQQERELEGNQMTPQQPRGELPISLLVP